MEIEEDSEPFWYLINCVAGLEMDLLRQCRVVCEDMPDAIKFVVPTENKTRSHGANRMVTETKVKYQGYVFAKLRLCAEVYEAIQGLDLCRSWMGTVNYKGYRKLPPAPVALNEVEVENFGLEDLEFEEEEEEVMFEGDKEIIVDEPGMDTKNQIDQEAIKAFLGLEVEDMVKVTKPCKFFNEDGIVRRLKDGKILVRFFTYGTMFEEWMDPSDVRKLNEIEVLKGLSGPSQPVTQRDFDAPKDAFGVTKGGRHAARSFGGGGDGPRNRRQDRVNRGQTNRGTDNWQQEEKNWNWYKEQKQDQGSVFEDDEWSFRPGSAQKSGSNDDSSQRGVPQSKRERRSVGQQNRNNGDWSSFVSPASAPAKGKEEDDFFASLMSDLSQDLGSGDSKSSSNEAFAAEISGSEEDNFFASLLNAEEEGSKQGSATADSSSTADVDDFFSSLATSVGDKSGESSSFDEDDLFGSFGVDGTDNDKADGLFSTLDRGLESEDKSEESLESSDDFFATLEQELGSALETDSEESGFDDEDFFAELGDSISSELDGSAVDEDSTGAEEGSALESDKEESTFDNEDFFAELGDTISSELDGSTADSHENSRTEPATASGSPDHDDLRKLTVPKLKEMLRARGMKVSGKKSDLIERLNG